MMIMMRNLQTFGCPRRHELLHDGFGFYKRGCRGGGNRVAEKDSEFEIDADKARDALRKLDQQLDRISQKQPNPLPKIKAPSPYNTTPYNARDKVAKDVPDAGSFLPYAFFGLLVFTIVYNIVFIKVIKPSIDGPQVELSPARSSIMKQILELE